MIFFCSPCLCACEKGKTVTGVSLIEAVLLNYSKSPTATNFYVVQYCFRVMHGIQIRDKSEAKEIDSVADLTFSTLQIKASPALRFAMIRVLENNQTIASEIARLGAEKNLAFDKDSVEHKQLLAKVCFGMEIVRLKFLCVRAQLWVTLMSPRQMIDLVHEDWGLVGFQGRDPSTDFRGMGKLVLV
jgi:hypothetical protein